MRLDPILKKELDWRFKKDNRVIIMVTRVKMFIHLAGSEWQENCSGLLIVCNRSNVYYLTIINIENYEINFDFEMYSNFINYTKFSGDQKCFMFVAPIQEECLTIMFALDNRQELVDLKMQV